SLGVTPPRPGNGDLAMAPHGVYATDRPDRWLTLAVRNNIEWKALLCVLDQVCNDTRFDSAEGRLRHREELDRVVGPKTAQAVIDYFAGR
ncbi:MAG TPA: CoA transferase, partial [Vicinamibacterales bacterium]|nr:CoA transferase [Vicinamibacterales bacterium]